ncbi:iron-siderophore ABC transporter substrate-binding protein [Naumannella halotolerans]|uniref:Iron complex transport system substrate-binding protein n=1 Tax=Naumannella halotolerans TaxID=993414 RepID=A0A4R7J8M1_9ACTN|nr:iron-siderophore ABC transporter substrate-binding protein [Naumannella halotolerans]TDT32719.1 iron complex transport system substrate-binding protein [Naumannella halotolerans]
MIRLATPSVALVAAAMLLTGCSSGDTDTGGDDGDVAAGFPATVGTKFGDVVVEDKPERVVALGWGDAEIALNLGVQPVGASDWLSFGGEGVGPWSAGLYDTPPEILGTLELSYEAVAALDPDLILDVRSSGDQEGYDRLSSIAPTIGVPEGGDNYLTDAEQQVTMIATALGEAEAGERMLAETEQAFADAAAAHPEWEGKTVSAVARTADGWGAYLEDSRVAFMKKLGFVQNPQVEALPPSDTGFSVDVSEEQLNLLDADVIVAFPIWVEATEITDDPSWQAIPAVEDGRAIVLDDDLSQAYSLGTPVSQRYALEQLVPKLEEAVPAQ